MSTTLNTPGRLGNQIFRNICVSILAKKYDLYVQYSEFEKIQRLGIPLYSGKNIYENSVMIDESRFLHLLKHENELSLNIITGDNYFQTREITRIIYDYLEPIRMRAHPKNNDVFIHLRLDDTADCNPGFKYYDKVLSSLSFTRGYISSDSPDHEICKQLLEKYPTLEIIQMDEVNTLLFGSSKKYTILSHGTFSAIIGYLSNSDVYYPQYNYSIKNTHSDQIFCIPSWIEVECPKTN